MKCLSIQQPWAWAILYAGKRIENRTWYTNFRGRIWIHAGMRVDRASIEDLADEIRSVPEPRPPAYRGAIVGRASIVDCVRVHSVAHDQRCWANGPWCFVLDDVEPLATPIPLKGRLGLFEAPVEVSKHLNLTDYLTMTEFPIFHGVAENKLSVERAVTSRQADARLRGENLEHGGCL